MIDRESDDYKIAVNELGHTVALAIDKFKKLVGCDRCSIDRYQHIRHGHI